MTVSSSLDRDVDRDLDVEQVVDTHLAAYCEPDPNRRRELLEAVWADGGRLADPPMDAEGIDGIAGLVDVVLGHYPGHRFVRTTAIDAHHGRARYAWALVSSDGSVAMTGLDVATFDGAGRLADVVGFFDDLPALDPPS